MESKAAWSSKTIQFNVVSGVIFHAAYPFLPERFRDPAFIEAWFTIGNIILRFVSYEAVTLFGRKNAQENPKSP